MPPVARTGIHIFDHDRDPNSYTLLDVKSTAVPLKFTWSKQAVLPCKLGVRKDVVLASLVRWVLLRPSRNPTPGKGHRLRLWTACWSSTAVWTWPSANSAALIIVLKP